MFNEMVIRFTNEKGRREAVIRPGSGITGVLLPGQDMAATAQRLGLNHRQSELAPGIIVRDADGQTLSASALSGEKGPGMCCIVGGDLICW